MKLWEGNVFTGVCHSVGGYVSSDDHQVSMDGGWAAMSRRVYEYVRVGCACLEE